MSVSQLKPDFITMEHKNISFQSNKVLQYFIAADRPYFTVAEVVEALPGVSYSALKELLSAMTKRGLLMRIKRGRYAIIPFEQNASEFLPDWHLLATELAGDTNHYIAYYSALQIHNLITQPALNEIVVVDKPIRPSKMEIKGVSFQFVYHNPQHFFGFKKTWINKFHKVYCSDLEKTFVDSLFQPEHSGGIVEIGKALYIARQSVNYDKLSGYCRQFDVQAVIKRLGFLLELLEIENPIINQLQELKTESYIPLDPTLPKEGKRSGRWNIQENVDLETIQASLLT